MESLALPILSSLDLGRSWLLKRVLANAWLRGLFVNRARRLLALYLLAVLIYLPLALFFPLWVLVIGPIVYGVPHIFASIRYVHYFVGESRQGGKNQLSSFHFLALIWVLVMIFRSLADRGVISASGLPFSWPELASVVVTFLGLAVLYRKSWMTLLRGLVLLVPLVSCSWFFPFATAGVLIILHNWIAFYFWFAACESKAEKRAALFALVIFALVHTMVLAGAFDGLYQVWSPQGSHSWAQMEYGELGRSIVPWSDDYHLWFHCVVLYAFGQAIHYFVWLKAIPDQKLQAQVPTSFRTSARLLQADIGAKALVLASLICLICLAGWFLIHLPQARALYFVIAAYHGYMELSALSLVRLRRC